MGFPRAGSNPAGCESNVLAVNEANMETKPLQLSGVGFEPTQSFDYESLNLTP